MLMSPSPSSLQVASPLLFTKEFTPVDPPVQPGLQPGATPLSLGGKLGGSTSGGVTIPVGGKAGGINMTPQLLQQLLASASKVWVKNHSMMSPLPWGLFLLSWPPLVLW